ncbi:M50 family metallopeptidase [Candidatus Woesearchaeota archaeon]|nr:M50 family metallopeptidase [Candidatus Woesearchaeota archaeon]
MITLMEIIDIVIMTLAIGYIFSDFFRKEPLEGYDPLTYYKRPPLWENIKFAAMIAAPAVVLHELAHKFVALYFGASATLHAPYFWYAVVVVLKLMGFPLLFFVGGYVAHTPLASMPSAIVAVAGPLINILLWLASIAVIKYNLIDKKYYKIVIAMGKINLFLGIFNMLPLPGFDGYHFFAALSKAFF